MRVGWAVGGIVLAALAGGCTSGDGGSPATWQTPSASAAGSPPPWKEPSDYGFVLARGCDDGKTLGRYQVTVRGGSVSTTERLDASAAPASGDVDLGPVTGDEGEEIETPTLGELVQMAQTATDDGGEVSTAYDTTDGHPVKVSINVSDEGPAGAECWSVSDYRPA